MKSQSQCFDSSSRETSGSSAIEVTRHTSRACFPGDGYRVPKTPMVGDTDRRPTILTVPFDRQ